MLEVLRITIVEVHHGEAAIGIHHHGTMIMTMIPAIGGATTAYAASPTIRLYLDKPRTRNTPVVHVWAAGAAVDNHGAGNATISQWWNQEKPKLAFE